MKENKYEAQIKYLRKNYKRLTVDFKQEDLEEFKRLCILNNTTPTRELKNFVKTYIKENKTL